MNGLHLTADLVGCPVDAAPMTDPGALRVLCVDAVHAVGLTAVADLFHPFAAAAGARFGSSGGVTGVVLLAESHLAVHTWPEIGAVTLDAYVCNFSADNSQRAQRLIETLIDALHPQRVERRQVARGSLVP